MEGPEQTCRWQVGPRELCPEQSWALTPTAGLYVRPANWVWEESPKTLWEKKPDLPYGAGMADPLSSCPGHPAARGLLPLVLDTQLWPLLLAMEF